MFPSSLYTPIRSSVPIKPSLNQISQQNYECCECKVLQDNNCSIPFLKPYLPNFKGYDGTSEDYNMPMRTSFFRDSETLEIATGLLKRNFPQGASILDYACSDGEEAISILALLDGDDENKYEIMALDKSSSAIKEAKKGRYREARGHGDEAFLFNPYEDMISGKNRKLKDKFIKIMDETTRNEKRIYGYTVKEKYQDKIKFQPFEQGDIFDINKINTSKPVGAVFFRNAMYQLLGRGFDYANQKNIYAQRETIIDLVDEVYNKLEPGGVFVLGNCIEDQYFNSFIAGYITKKMPDSFVPVNNHNILRKIPTVWLKLK